MKGQVHEEILSDIRNKLTVPTVALEKLAKGEKVPQDVLELAVNNLSQTINLLQELNLSDEK